MNSRERLRRCYFHEELDRPAVYSRTGFPSGDPTYTPLKEYLAAHSDLKLTWETEWDLSPRLPITYRTEPYSNEFSREIATLHTPAGDLEATRFISLTGKPGLAETYFIKDRRDVERFLSLPVPEPTGDLATFFRLDEKVGGRGIVDVSLGDNPAGYVSALMGSETLAILSITDRDCIHALCAWRLEALLLRIRYLLAHDVGPFFSTLGEELVVPPLHGPQDFWDFNVRYDKPMIDLIHNGGGRVHVHCHGSIRKVFTGFIESGADVLHPIEPPPMGDITAAEAKALARGRLCLEGNIQIADMYEQTPEEIRSQVLSLVNAAFDDQRGLIVAPSASPYIRGQGAVCFPQYKAMVDTVLGYE